MKVAQAVRERIRELQEKNHMTRGALSRASGVPKSTLNDIMNGISRDVTLGTLVKIANGFDLTVREFMDDRRFNIIDQE